ncbi:unnamed protein product [Rotaria sp. Silwood1]|nr:unnamed protein product [Rotaria sp. Silwood1]
MSLAINQTNVKETDKNNNSTDVKRQVQHPPSTNIFLNTRGRLMSIDDIQKASVVSSNPYLVYPRRKSSSVALNSSVLHSIEDNINGHIVRIRLIFIRIGEIDTLNEKYQADIYFEARWIDRIDLDTLDLTAQQRTQLINELATIRLNDFSPITHWTPELSIENAIAHIGMTDSYG